MSPVAVLVGAPGAGKSTVGKRLASALSVEFADADALIEADMGMSVSDIFVTLGEAEFRAKELSVIGSALRECTGVLALGGGAIVNPLIREALKGTQVVWLQVDIASAASRVGMNTSRPLLMGNVRGKLAELMAERAPLYEEVSTITVVTSGRKVREVVDELLERLSDEPLND
ncbi:MAG: shikimate kinase [Actinomycetota bacterium]|nr:shikimate kinase [Actinomycetota bacterium]